VRSGNVKFEKRKLSFEWAGKAQKEFSRKQRYRLLRRIRGLQQAREATNDRKAEAMKDADRLEDREQRRRGQEYRLGTLGAASPVRQIVKDGKPVS
jgi:hypothetical protein